MEVEPIDWLGPKATQCGHHVGFWDDFGVNNIRIFFYTNIYNIYIYIFKLYNMYSIIL